MINQRLTYFIAKNNRVNEPKKKEEGQRKV